LIEEKAKGDASGSENEELRKELDTIKTKLSTANTELERGQVYLKNAQNRGIDLQRKLDTSNTNHGIAMAAAEADATKAASRIRQLEDDLDERTLELKKEGTRAMRAVEEAEEWKKLLSDTKTKHEQSTKQNRVLQEQVVKLKRELADIIDEAAGVEQQNIEVKAELVKLDETAAELTRVVITIVFLHSLCLIIPSLFCHNSNNKRKQFVVIFTVYKKNVI
jgi:chromosome segregation ATPase